MIRRFVSCMLTAMAGCFLFGCSEADVAPRSMLEMSVPGSSVIGREVVSPTEERLRARGEGREIPAIVLLPDNYSARARYPLVLAVHNFGGSPSRIAGMMEAERLRKAGSIVIVPQAEGLISEWQGPGITLSLERRGPDGRPVDDVAGLVGVLAAARELYRIDDANVNLAGFSQGATLVFELARRLTLQRPGSVRRVFAVAGSVVDADRQSLALSGADIVHYEPGVNWLQQLANWRTGEPPETEFTPWILSAKDCELREHKQLDGVDTQIYTCRDGRSVTRVYEQGGEHAWPGQPAEYDIWLLGRGSISRFKLTDLMISEIASPDTHAAAER
jgi:poly(3-hydroxybutyrate) depolymerase